MHSLSLYFFLSFTVCNYMRNDVCKIAGEKSHVRLMLTSHSEMNQERAILKRVSNNNEVALNLLNYGHQYKKRRAPKTGKKTEKRNFNTGKKKLITHKIMYFTRSFTSLHLCNRYVYHNKGKQRQNSNTT